MKECRVKSEANVWGFIHCPAEHESGKVLII